MWHLRCGCLTRVPNEDHVSRVSSRSSRVSRFGRNWSGRKSPIPIVGDLSGFEGLLTDKQRTYLHKNPSCRGHPVHALIPAEEEKQTRSEKDCELDKFSWFKNWWPVQAVDNLKTDRPNKVQLLGKDFIVWKGHSGKWIAMDDECPHRMAPLSEGRIEKDGNLLCSYHAWRFNESGKCVKIPHAEDEKAHSIACSSPRSAVQTYPCQARGALLWIWPDDSPTAESDSVAVALPLEKVVLDKLDLESDLGISQPYVRFVPYNYDILVENLTDPAHFHVAHHKATPRHSRYRLTPLRARPFEGLGEVSTINAMKYVPVGYHDKLGVMEHRHPGVVFSALEDQKTKRLSGVLVFFQVPVSLGQSIFIAVGGRSSSLLDPKAPSLLARFLRRPMSWMTHILFFHKVIDGDVVLLAHQDRKLRQKGHLANASKQYFTPSSADFLCMAFRRWFETVGGHGAEYGANQQCHTNVEITKEQLLDRYEQHTKHCKVCSEALEAIKKTVAVFKAVSVFALFTAMTILLTKSTQNSFSFFSILRTRRIVASLLCLVWCSAMAFLMETKFIPLFYFVDFSHADNH